MFVYSFKASSVKFIGVFVLCLLAATAAIIAMPGAGSLLNVNKFDGSAELMKIDASGENGRIEFIETLGYTVNDTNVSKQTSVIPKEFDIALEKYNNLQRSQGFDLTKYTGKKLTGYTYEVSSFPDGSTNADNYLATVIVYGNKVVGADLCCVEKGDVLPLVKMI